MAIAIQGYQQQVATPSAGGSPQLHAVNQPVIDVSSDINHLARVYEKVEEDQAETEAMRAVARTRMDVEESYRTAQEKAGPGADQFTPMFLGLYDGEVNKTADALPSELSRKKYREKMLGFGVGLQERALGWEADQRRSERKRSFDEAADNHASTLFSTDAGSRETSFDMMRGEMDKSLGSVDLPPDAKAELREKIKTKLSYAAVQGDLRDRPEMVQGALVKGSGDSYYSKLRSVESGGRNIGSDTSSAFGPYQFTSGTWAGLAAKHPELNLTAKDRFDPVSQEVAIRAFTADNEKILKGMGLPATNANLYMMHFLGEGGGPKFLSALSKNGNDEARLHVGPAQVAANPGIFKPGRTVNDVYMLFGKKFGTSEDVKTQGSSPSYYNDLSFQHRNTLYDQADAELRKRRSEGAAAFGQVVQNTVSEYASTGSSPNQLSEQQFTAAYGPEKGALAYGEFQANVAGAEAAHKVQYLPAAAVNDFVEAQRPEPGDPFYAEKQKAFTSILSNVAQLTKERADDPAAVVARQQPEAAKALMDGVTTGNSEAISQWVAATQAAGVNRVLPNSVKETLLKNLGSTPVDTVAATGVWTQIKQQKAAWGDSWPAVLRELGEQGGDLRVLGAVDEQTAITLLANKRNSLTEIGKTLPAGTLALNDGELQTSFEDYAASLRLPGEDGAPFYAAAQKLAALSVQSGEASSGSAAATAAFKRVLGDRYVFEGVTRIPRANEMAKDSLEPAKMQALETADMRKLPAGVSSEDARAWMARETQWVTTPDDRGVVLMHGSIAARDSTGRVIARSWRDIGEVAATRKVDVKTKRIGEFYDSVFRPGQ